MKSTSLRLSCRTDIDLHVHEPDGNHVYYGNRYPRSGGILSRDFRHGYGPEEYIIREAQEGRYDIRAKYFSNHRQDRAGGTTLLLTVSTNFGRPSKDTTSMVALRLSENKESIAVGSVRFYREKATSTVTGVPSAMNPCELDTRECVRYDLFPFVDVYIPNRKPMIAVTMKVERVETYVQYLDTDW